MDTSMLESGIVICQTSLGKTGFAEKGFGLCQTDAPLKLASVKLHPRWGICSCKDFRGTPGTSNTGSGRFCVEPSLPGCSGISRTDPLGQDIGIPVIGHR